MLPTCLQGPGMKLGAGNSLGAFHTAGAQWTGAVTCCLLRFDYQEARIGGWSHGLNPGTPYSCICKGIVAKKGGGLIFVDSFQMAATPVLDPLSGALAGSWVRRGVVGTWTCSPLRDRSWTVASPIVEQCRLQWSVSWTRWICALALRSGLLAASKNPATVFCTLHPWACVV